MKKTAMDELLNQAEALCKVYVGRQWGETLERLVELDKAVKKARRAQKAIATKAMLTVGTDV